MEACLEEMRLANAHLEVVMAELQERLFEEQRATTREKAQERLRAKLAPAQKTLTGIAKAVHEAKETGSSIVVLPEKPIKRPKIARTEDRYAREG